VTFESDFGPARTNYWHGVEVTANARMRNGFVLQGGTSTGREVEDRCESVVKIDSPDPRNCRTVAPFQTTFRGSASYTLPKVDVLVSTIVRSQTGARAHRQLQLPEHDRPDAVGTPAGRWHGERESARQPAQLE
jgi:hypothetical protein